MDLASEEWVKFALVDAERRKCITEVLAVESEPAVKKGENYGSTMYRLRVKVVNGQGELEERPLIFKSSPKTKDHSSYVLQSGFFQQEAMIYKYVLPNVEKIFKYYNAGEYLWPKFFGLRGQNGGFLLNDLSAQGYKLLDRLKGLDFDGANLVLQSLAKYHAATAVLLERGEIASQLFPDYYFVRTRETSDIFHGENIKYLAKLCEKRWKGEWVTYAEKLRQFCDNLYEKLQSIFKNDYNSKFKVLCHADPWISNMLFKEDKNGKLISVKFLDFPISYVGSVAMDVGYFLSTSLRLCEFHREKELQDNYFRALTDHLKEFQLYGPLPTYEEFQDYLKSMRVNEFLAGLVIRPIIMLPSERAVNVEDLFTEEYGVFKSPCGYDYNGQEYVASLQYFIKKGEQYGLI